MVGLTRLELVILSVMLLNIEMGTLPITRKKRSIIWKISTYELQELLNRSSSIQEVLLALGLKSTTGGNRETLQQRILKDNLETSILQGNRDANSLARKLNTQWARKIDNNNLFTENSSINRGTVRKRILSEELLPYVCSECGNTGEYNNKPLSLQLDHINGINNDHRLINLRFLCPNCHTQTDTHSGKRLKKTHTCNCGVEIRKESTSCKKCASPEKIKWLNDEEFAKKLWDMPTSHLAEILGVSDSAIGKRAKKLGLKNFRGTGEFRIFIC
jgi:5-methylcytosine-specific restriction endonuclease McrA